jgi:hypothetical protein
MRNEDQEEDPAHGVSRLEVFTGRLHHALPPRLRDLTSVVARRYRIIRRLRPEVWIITGEERGTGLPLSVCLYVTSKEYKSYLLDLIFGSSFSPRYLGRTWLWNAFKAIPRAAAGCSLVIAEVEESHLKLPGAKSGLVIPAWVYGQVDLPRGPGLLRSKSIQDDLRKIRQHSLEFEVSRDSRRFEDFYQNMYVPYIKARHGGGAFLVQKEAMKAHLDRGELVLVRKQGEYISGTLIIYDPGLAHLAYMGVRDGNRDFVLDGAIAAAHEFSLRHLEKKGYKKISIGRSRPFLRDGALRYKRKWTQKIVAGSPHKFLVNIVSDTNATRAFLQNNPFIFERCGELHGAVFMTGGAPVTQNKLGEIQRAYAYPGLSKLVVFCFPDSGTGALNLPAGRLHFECLSQADSTPLVPGLGPLGIVSTIVIHPESSLN